MCAVLPIHPCCSCYCCWWCYFGFSKYFSAVMPQTQFGRFWSVRFSSANYKDKSGSCVHWIARWKCSTTLQAHQKLYYSIKPKTTTTRTQMKRAMPTMSILKKRCSNEERLKAAKLLSFYVCVFLESNASQYCIVKSKRLVFLSRRFVHRL